MKTTRHIDPYRVGLLVCWPTALVLLFVRAAHADTLQLHLRTRVHPFKANDTWEEVVLTQEFPTRETALLICDMWDKHWCQNAAKRCDALARKMEPIIQAARERGIRIIHAPSECMDFYKDMPQRKRMAELGKGGLPTPLELTDPPLPIDCSDGGCDDDNPVKSYKAWSREHPAISIGEDDVISDNGAEIYNFLHQKGIKNLLVCGVHTNFCILGRSFGIRQMSKWGIRCILIRDLTDSMYNPKRAPFVSHEEGTELVIQHIEKYWCPSILAVDLTTGKGFDLKKGRQYGCRGTKMNKAKFRLARNPQGLVLIMKEGPDSVKLEKWGK